MKFTNLVTPPWCRWSATNPPKFTLSQNILYAAVGGVFSANLYYSHPILHLMTETFITTQSGVANIPTLAQAGDATGLILVLPLADFIPRRRFTLLMLTFTLLFWIGLCITTNLAIFQVLTYLSAVTTGVIQILLVLVAELSTAENRAFNISIVAVGPTLGILLARILSGIVANYIAWRYVYVLSLALQVAMLALMWCFMPDYPVPDDNANKTKMEVAKEYPGVLVNILSLFVKYPALVQASLLSFLTFFCVASYWTTLTFLLAEPPYEYSTIVIGLFGLIGASTMILGPLFGRYIIQPIRSSLLSAALGVAVSLIGIILGTALGKTSIVGPVFQAILLDAGLMILQVCSRIIIHDIEPGSRNSVNSAFVTCLYVGMLAGTKAGNDVYEKYGGWLAAGGLSIGIMAMSYVIILARGPHETGWIGWRGGWARDEKEDIESNKGSEQALQEGPRMEGEKKI